MTTTKMNVCSNAYYTSDFLRHRHLQNTKELIIPPGYKAESKIPRSAPNENHVEAPQSNLPNQALHHSTHNEFQAFEKSHNAPIHSNNEKSRERSVKYSVDYHDYYGSTSRILESKPRGKHHDKPKRSFFRTSIAPSDAWSQDEVLYRGDDASLYEPSIPKPQSMSGFYIDQQKKYDASKDIKPKMYSHRAFKEVFQNDKEDRLSPMDVVFDDPSKRDLNSKQKFMRAFKHVVPKFGRNDYAHYDYTQQVDWDEPETLDVRSESDRSEWEYLNEGAASSSKESPPFPIRSKQFDARGTVREIAHEHSVSEEHFDLSSITTHNESFDKQIMPSSSPPNFNPLWNYMLSWLVYNSPQISQPEFAEDGKIEDIIECGGNDGQPSDRKSDLRKVSDKIKKGKGFKEKFSKWSAPADKFLSTQNRNASGVMVKLENSQMQNYGYNNSSCSVPDTAQMESYSWKTRDTQMSDHAMMSKFDDKSPKVIISNVNKLIKNIRVIRVIFAPIDLVAENFPKIQTFVIFIELFIFMWILYELSLLIDALCMAVKAICAPMIAIGKFMNRIV